MANGIGVLVRVWGWGDAAMAAHDSMLANIILRVAHGLEGGEDEHALEDALMADYFALFSDCHIEVGVDGAQILLAPRNDGLSAALPKTP